jgi:shikimate dehydrogenase
VTYDNPTPDPDVKALIARLKSLGFQVLILSNGRKERVEAFGAALGVPVIWKAGKPFGNGFRRAKAKMGLEGKQIAILGDQIFTDVWGGNVANVYSILIKPISEEKDEWMTKPKRGLEKRLIAKYRLRPLSKWHKRSYDKAIMKVDGCTRILGVIGDPIEHTLSPFIHSLMIRERGDNYLYTPIRVKKEELGDAIAGAWAMNMAGLNVTVPHKQAVMAYLEGLDESARLVGAVNVLKRTPTGFRGYNTDMAGVTFLMKVNHVNPEGAKILILGAGGAARAAVAACWKGGASEIVIWNRTPERAEAMINEFLQMQPDCPLRLVTTEDLHKEVFPIVIHATSAGMKPNIDLLPVDDAIFYQGIRYGLDIVFNPMETAFCKKVRSCGGKADNGLSMLFYQAVKAYEIWTERTFTDKEVAYMRERFMMMAEGKLSHE